MKNRLSLLLVVVSALLVVGCSEAPEPLVSVAEPHSCATSADCPDNHTCIPPGLGIGPVWQCFDETYVYCSTWGSIAVNEASMPDSLWSCADGEVFALCAPTLSAAIEASCRPAKEYNPTTESYRYSCCSPELFGQ